MKSTTLYLESSTYCWNCRKCGKPNLITVTPQGIFDLDGNRIAGPQFLKKPVVLKCSRTILTLPSGRHIPCCETKRKVNIQEAIFGHTPKNVRDRLNDLHTKKLKEENEVVRLQQASVIRAEIEKKVREEMRQSKSKKKPKFKKRRLWDE